MKKLLLLGAAALMSVISASAQLYITGDNTSPSWTPGTPMEVSLENGQYTFTLKGNFKMSTVKGTWAQFNGACKVLQGGKWTVGENQADGVLVKGDANINSPATGKEVTYVINEDLTSISATWEGEVAAPDFYLIGGAVGGWVLADAVNKMTREGNVYTITKSSLNGEWKINNGTWDLGFGQGEASPTPKAGVVYNVSSDGGSANLKTAFTSEVTITFTYVANGQSTLLITTDGEDPNPPTPPTPGDDYTGWYLNVQGDYNSWTPSGVAFNEDGTATSTDQAIGDGEFELKIWNGTADSFWGTATPVEIGVPTEVTEGGGHMTIAGAAAGDKFDVAFDYPTQTMTVTKVGGGDDPIPPTPEYKDLYLVGTTPGWTDINDAYKFDREDNVYTLTLPETIEAGWKIWDGSWTYNFGAGAEQPVFGETYQTWFDGGDFTISIPQGGVIKLTLVAGSDKKNSSIPSELLIDGNTGVETIEAAEGEAVYYNLQGARVLNPANGLFVRVANGKAVKVVK
ncbi:MAG: hypothetical protein K2M87_03905 [Muribaculaceae bacterium]|nr:hypothetical protein [Muribaculaceae bacterium]